MKYNALFASLLLAALPFAAIAQNAPAAPDLGPRLARAAARIGTLDHRADRVADYDELKNLQQIYGFYVDKALWDDVVDLFADDGSLELGGVRPRRLLGSREVRPGDLHASRLGPAYPKKDLASS